MQRFLFFILSLFLTPAAWAQPVTFGASVQLTGPVANTGRYYKDAYEFAVDKINAAGGIKIGSAHQKIALKILDNQSDVNLSVRQYVQLLAQDKVNFLLGPFASNFVLADFGRPAEAVNRALLQRGVIVRPVDNYGLPNHLRITTGTAAQNERLLAALGEIAAGGW